MLPLAPPASVPPRPALVAQAKPPRFAAPTVVTRTATATWGPPALAIDERGRRLVAWVAHGRVVAGGRAISRRGAGPPSLALAPDGSAAALWSRELKRGRKLLELSIAPPGGRFGRPRRLADVHGTIDGAGVYLEATVSTNAQTGVEMEALTAVAVAAQKLQKALSESIKTASKNLSNISFLT